MTDARKNDTLAQLLDVLREAGAVMTLDGVPVREMELREQIDRNLVARLGASMERDKLLTLETIGASLFDPIFWRREGVLAICRGCGRVLEGTGSFYVAHYQSDCFVPKLIQRILLAVKEQRKGGVSSQSVRLAWKELPPNEQLECLLSLVKEWGYYGKFLEAP